MLGVQELQTPAGITTRRRMEMVTPSAGPWSMYAAHPFAPPSPPPPTPPPMITDSCIQRCQHNQGVSFNTQMVGGAAVRLLQERRSGAESQHGQPFAFHVPQTCVGSIVVPCGVHNGRLWLNGTCGAGPLVRMGIRKGHTRTRVVMPQTRTPHRTLPSRLHWDRRFRRRRPTQCCHLPLRQSWNPVPPSARTRASTSAQHLTTTEQHAWSYMDGWSPVRSRSRGYEGLNSYDTSRVVGG